MIKLRCKDCRFYEPYNQDIHENMGQCRKNPPVVIVIADGVETYWPDVYGHEWCGQREQTKYYMNLRMIDAEGLNNDS